MALLSLGFLMAAARLQGAAITWAPATDIAGDSDVLNTGTPVYAYSWSGITSTVNGVRFTGSAGTNGGNNVLAPAFSNYGPAYFTSKAKPFSALSTAYSNILIGADYVVRLPVPVTLENLTIGRDYAVQVWVNDPRGPENARSETITSAGGNTNTLRFSINATNTSPGGPGQFTIGYFTADTTNQTFTLNGGTNVTQMNALQLRDVTSGSGTTIRAGQTWTLGFKSIPLLNPVGGNPGQVSVTFFTAPGGPATATLDLFENTLSDPPLTFSLTWTNQPQPILGANTANIWTDHQGWIRLHVVTGKVTFSSMNVDVYDYFTGLYEFTFYQPSLSEVLSTNSSGILHSTLQWQIPNSPAFAPNVGKLPYTLQSSLSCGSGSWSDVTNQPVVDPGISSVTVDEPGSQRFYRLINTNFSMMLQ
jgi:hypothetical protein